MSLRIHDEGEMFRHTLFGHHSSHLYSNDARLRQREKCKKCVDWGKSTKERSDEGLVIMWLLSLSCKSKLTWPDISANLLSLVSLLDCLANYTFRSRYRSLSAVLVNVCSHHNCYLLVVHTVMVLVKQNWWKVNHLVSLFFFFLLFFVF